MLSFDDASRPPVQPETPAPEAEFPARNEGSADTLAGIGRDGERARHIPFIAVHTRIVAACRKEGYPPEERQAAVFPSPFQIGEPAGFSAAGVSEAIFKIGMCLPAGPYVTDEDVKYIVETIKNAIVG